MLRRLAWLVPLLAIAGCGFFRGLVKHEPAEFSPDAMDHLGDAAFAQLRGAASRPAEPHARAIARCVVRALVRGVQRPGGDGWEVVVFDDPSAVAFAFPGGKVGVHTGLIASSRDDDTLAAVVAHGIGHVLGGHAGGRVATLYRARYATQIINAIDESSPNAQRTLFGALGAAPPVGTLLPFTEEQEVEADRLGLGLMAQAGFDPAQSVALARSDDGEGVAPDFRRAHPPSPQRAGALEAHLPVARRSFESLRRDGRLPHCEDAAPPTDRESPA